MQKRGDDFHKLGIQIKVVSFAPIESLRPYLNQFSWGFDLFSDSERQIYKLFGLGRAKPWKIFHPRTVIKFITLLLKGVKGAKVQKSKEDEFQMGGDFLIDASGHLRYIFRSETPDDRPSLEQLLSACRSTVRAKGA